MSPTLLIDVDGTISDSLPGIQEGFRIGLAAVDHPLPDDEFLARLAGPPMYESMARAGLTGDRLDAALAAYREQQHAGGWADTRMFDGWPELLDGWRADGIRLSTATSKGGYFARKVLDRFGILDRFDFIGAADDGGTRHEKIDVLDHTLTSLDLPAERRAPVPPTPGGPFPTVMVGDRIHDIEGAHTFGLPCIAVGWGYGPDEERERADAIAHDMAELDRHARSLLGM